MNAKYVNALFYCILCAWLVSWIVAIYDRSYIIPRTLDWAFTAIVGLYTAGNVAVQILEKRKKNGNGHDRTYVNPPP